MEVVKTGEIHSIPIKIELNSGRVDKYLNVWRGIGTIGFAATDRLPKGKAFGIPIGVNKEGDMIGGLLVEEIPQFIELLQMLVDSPAPELPEEYRALFSEKELEFMDQAK